MSNNRLSIRCRECGEECILASYSPVSPFTWVLYADCESKLQEFFLAHRHTHNSLAGPTHFTVAYEWACPSTAEIDSYNEQAGYDVESIFDRGDLQ